MADVLHVESVVTPEGIVGPALVRIIAGRIDAIEPSTEGGEPGTLVPGFVDLQVNGVDRVDVASASGDDWDRMGQDLLAQGVTTWCPTVISRPLGDYGPILDRIAEAAERPGRRPHLAGAHLEGPFLAVPGAHDPGVLRAPDPAWIADLPPIVAVVTLAPELPGGLDAVEALADRGVLVSVGHTAADLETVHAAAGRGARLATHLFNAMAPVHHRDPGPVVGALTCDDLVVAVIADGFHLHPAVVDLIRRAAGPRRVLLVSDQVGTPEGDDGSGTPPRLRDGTLAGSRLHLDQAVGRAVRSGGFGLVDAVHAASTLPAHLLGLEDRGAIEPGHRADLVLLDDDLRATRTWLAEDWSDP